MKAHIQKSNSPVNTISLCVKTHRLIPCKMNSILHRCCSKILWCRCNNGNVHSLQVNKIYLIDIILSFKQNPDRVLCERKIHSVCQLNIPVTELVSVTTGKTAGLMGVKLVSNGLPVADKVIRIGCIRVGWDTLRN